MEHRRPASGLRRPLERAFRRQPPCHFRSSMIQIGMTLTPSCSVIPLPSCSPSPPLWGGGAPLRRQSGPPPLPAETAPYFSEYSASQPGEDPSVNTAPSPPQVTSVMMGFYPGLPDHHQRDAEKDQAVTAGDRDLRHGKTGRRNQSDDRRPDPGKGIFQIQVVPEFREIGGRRPTPAETGSAARRTNRRRRQARRTGCTPQRWMSSPQ